MNQTEKVETLALLDRWGKPDEITAHNLYLHERTGFSRKIVVLDDDPTGVQAIHDIPVYTDWSTETIARGLRRKETMFFILTNSRSFSAAKTEAVHREIASNLTAASRSTGIGFMLVSRGDSTLRGHFPLETETLRHTLESESDLVLDGEIILPFLPEAGRFTAEDVHYVRNGEKLVPAGQTEFAADTSFGFYSSNLKEWCEEKTCGRCKAKDVFSVSLEELRAFDVDGIAARLMNVQDFRKVVVNALSYADLYVFAAALLRAVNNGQEFILRSAAAILKVLGNVSDRPLLTHDELVDSRIRNGGLIVVGSHVAKTTRQLETLRARFPELLYLCFDATCVASSDTLSEESNRIRIQTEAAISAGRTAVIYTSRALLRSATNDNEANLRLSVSISNALTDLVSSLKISPAFVLAKGGITSNDIGVKALRVRQAMVMGQVASAVPVWRTDVDSTFPGIPYVIFPGNVGGDSTLAEVIACLLGQE